MIFIKYYKIIVVLILVLLLSLLPADTTPKIRFINIPHFDKLVHFIMYLFLTLASLIDIKKNIKNPTKQLVVSVIFSIVILSGIIEIIQENLIFGRSGNLYDFFANISGTLIASFIFYKTSIFSKSLQGF